MSRKKWGGILIFMGLFVFGSIVFLIVHSDRQEQPTVRVGFVMTGLETEDGWSSLQYQGICAACEELDVELFVREGVQEEKESCTQAIKELAQEGVNVIFLNSYNYFEKALEAIRDYSQIAFYVCCSTENGNDSPNVTPYFARVYQARYLSGLIAGAQTESGRIGYVAAMPNVEVNRGIDAFALGVRKANPDAKVIVAWTGAWEDEERERALTQGLIADEQVDVITYHQNRPYVIEEAEEAGIYSIGYHEKPDGVSERYLTTVQCDWKMTYQEILKDYLRGKINEKSYYWVGLAQKGVDLTPYSEAVVPQARKLVVKEKRKILRGQDVFSGLIKDNEGTLRCSKDETLSDAVLQEKLTWYVEGVEFYDR